MKTIEIERKFLVRNNTWRADAIASHAFQQAYLSHGSKNTVRVRIIDGLSARLAVKFGGRGLKREEYEYEIPVAEAQELLRHANGRVLEKRRYDVSHKGRIWEVDVFGGAYQGADDRRDRNVYRGRQAHPAPVARTGGYRRHAILQPNDGHPFVRQPRTHARGYGHRN